MKQNERGKIIAPYSSRNSATALTSIQKSGCLDVKEHFTIQDAIVAAQENAKTSQHHSNNRILAYHCVPPLVSTLVERSEEFCHLSPKVVVVSVLSSETRTRLCRLRTARLCH